MSNEAFYTKIADAIKVRDRAKLAIAGWTDRLEEAEQVIQNLVTSNGSTEAQAEQQQDLQEA